ncbi:hypothetical protein DUNSADRAFT_2370 [Dunaliella salina]|uniref:Encoded protein n=1 Tax=Dunaliella salina TaxID=3046 RepID=A0ABQ7FWD6_DUNSA|nr:hypothetical protein DUNSADRAFT_2370 [Dunaliella salina]|eukprot:KAF5826684.1 hypothetical protein DUNSADRAFT_2370 [Dunaliella salina]
MRESDVKSSPAPLGLENCMPATATAHQHSFGLPIQWNKQFIVCGPQLLAVSGHKSLCRKPWNQPNAHVQRPLSPSFWCFESGVMAYMI